MSRKRHQQGSLKIVRGRWIAQWWEEGHRRNKLLGKASKVTKSQAKDKLAEILAPINTKQQGPSEDWKFGDFDQTHSRLRHLAGGSAAHHHAQNQTL